MEIWKAWLLATALALLAGAAGVWLGWEGRGRRDAQERVRIAALRARDSTCVLATRDPTSDKVPVFAQWSNARELADAARRGESPKTLELILKDADGFFVDRGTSCSLIGNASAGIREIRVTSGPHAGKTGHVPNEWRMPE